MDFQNKKFKKIKQLCAIRHALYPQRGYALLLSVLISALILTIGLGILNIVEKKIILSSLGRESQKAFYAADSGGECTLYWDRKHEGFGSTVFATSSASTPPLNGVLCNEQDIAEDWIISDVTATGANTSFTISFANGSCVTVDVQKLNSGLMTRFLSRGHNICDLSSSRVVERAMRIVY